MAHGMEAYLEAIYVIASEGETVLPSKVAEFLGVSRPTVTQTMHRMTTAGYVKPGERKEITLTEDGRKRAEAIVRKHRLLERWLTDVLGLDWADAHVEAGRLEHSVSPLVEARLYEEMGRPNTCPHGNVIPGSGFQQPIGTPLSSIEQPRRVQVVRIVELAEEDLDLLRFLHKTGIVPGADIEVLARMSPYEAGVPITVRGQAIALDRSAARRVLVTLDA